MLFSLNFLFLVRNRTNVGRDLCQGAPGVDDERRSGRVGTLFCVEEDPISSVEYHLGPMVLK